jgi:Ca-activated chloride channel family protein
MLTLQYPWLLLLLAMPLAATRLLPPFREARASLRVPFMGRLEDASHGKAAAGSAVREAGRAQKAFLFVVWALVVLSLARPQWVGDSVSKTIASRDILLAVDLSTSMEQQDFTSPEGESIDRLQAVKLVVDDFLSRREGDRVGLILFGSAAFVQTPFTEDIQACRALLAEAEIGMAGPQTVLGDAIGLAITVFEKSELEERVLILLTDGNDSGSKVPPDNAARIAADYGITIHTVVVGAADTEGRDAIDAEALQGIAVTTGGGFYRASNRQELEAIYTRIDATKTRDAEVVTHRPTSDLFHWPLAAGLVLAMVGHAGVALTGPRGGRE